VKLIYNATQLQACGHDIETIEKDTSRVKYFSPEEAIDYGLIDQVMYPESLRVKVSTIMFLSFPN
jgi:ATP-dependent protease ClpP protease subunit